jgi:hypothetical protein
MKVVGPAASVDVGPIRPSLPDAHHREAQHARPRGPLDVTAVLPDLLAAPRVPVQDLVATGTETRGGLSIYRPDMLSVSCSLNSQRIRGYPIELLNWKPTAHSDVRPGSQSPRKSATRTDPSS